MRSLVLLATLGLLLCGCNDSSSPDPTPATQYNTVTINNSTFYATKQLVRLELTPVGGGTTLSKSFVCSYPDHLAVEMAIPAMGSYRVEIFAADGQSMWWDSVAMALPGTTDLMVTCGSSPITFWGSCASLAPSGTTMTP